MTSKSASTDESGFALVTTLLVVLVVSSTTVSLLYYNSAKSLKTQTAALQKKVDATLTNQSYSQELPAGSVQFSQLSPGLQKLIDTGKTTEQATITGSTADPTKVTNTTEVNNNTTDVTNEDDALLGTANTWLNPQTFSNGFDINNSTYNSLTGSNLVDTNGTLNVALSDSITTADLRDGAVTFTKLGSDSCADNTILQLSGGSWGCSSLSNGISTTDLQEGSVTLNKIATDSCTDSVDFLEFSSGAWGCDSLNNSIATSELQAGAVTFDKLNGTGCSDYNVLQYVGGNWNCAIVSGVSGGIYSLNNFTDPSLTITMDNNGTAPALTNSNDNIDISIPYASEGSDGVLSASDYTTFTNNLFTAGNGLTDNSGTLTSNATTGVSGGQTLTGGTDPRDNLTLTSTSDLSKGYILFGDSGYDETNNRLGIGTATPSYALDIDTASASGLEFNVASTSTSLTGSGLASFNWSPSSSTTSTGNLVNINAGAHATIASLLNVSNNGTSILKVGQSSITLGAPVTFTSSTTEPVNIENASYTLTSSDNTVIAEAPSGNIILTLPNPSGITGRIYTIKRADAPTFTMTVKSTGTGVTIDQQSSILLTHQGNTIEVVSDGTNWDILSQWTSSYTYSNSEPFSQGGNTGDLGN